MATTWKNSLRTTLGSKTRVFEKIIRFDETGKKVTMYGLLRRGPEQDAAAAGGGGVAAAGHHVAPVARADGSVAPLPLHHDGIGVLSARAHPRALRSSTHATRTAQLDFGTGRC